MAIWIILGLAVGVLYYAFQDGIHKAICALLYELGLSKDDGGGPCDSRY
jgi:hypothetical protein